MGFLEQLKNIFFPPAMTPPPASNTPNTPNTQDPIQRQVSAIHQAKNQEDYPEALRLLDELIPQVQAQGFNTLWVDLKLSQADIYLIQGRSDEAHSAIHDAHDLAQTLSGRAAFAYSLCALGTLEQAHGDWDAAKAHYEHARDIAKHAEILGVQGRAIAHLADVAMHDKNPNYAIHLLMEALPMMERSGDTELLPHFAAHLANAFLQVGRINDAETLLNRALQAATSAQNQRARRTVNVRLGVLLYQQAKDERAYQHLKQAHQLLADHVYVEERERLEILAYYALSALKQGHTLEASQPAERAYQLAQAQQDAELIALTSAALGRVKHWEGDDANAESYLNTALAYYAEHQQTAMNIELLEQLADLQAKHQPTLALETLQRAADSAESAKLPLVRAQVLNRQAGLHLQQNQLNEAASAFQHALRLYQSEHKASQVALVQVQLGGLYLRMGQSRAQREYENALLTLNSVQDSAIRGQVLYEVAHYYMRSGDVDSAESFFEEAVQLATQGDKRLIEAERRGTYGVFLALIGEGERGVAELLRAKELIAEDASQDLRRAFILTRLGIAYRTLGQITLALDYHKQALALVDPSAQAAEAAWMRVQKADTLLAQTQAPLAQAQEYYAFAEHLWRSRPNAALLVLALLGLGRIALLEQRLGEAQRYLEEADGLASRAALRRPLADVRLYQSQLYAAQAKPNQAQTSYQEAAKLRRILKLPELTPTWLG